MIGENIQRFRKEAHLSQEELAEKVGVARQTVAKWENGTTIPDIYACMAMADAFDISLDALAMKKKHPNPAKHVFGAVRIGERGQIVIPKRCREIFDLKPGDMMVLFGDEERGLALVQLSVDMFEEDEEQEPEGKNV